MRGGKILWSLQGRKRLKISCNKGIKRKSKNLTLGWPNILRFWPLPKEDFIAPKGVFCFPLELWQRPYSCFYCENKGWRMESKNLQKGCGQDQLVLLFARQDEGADILRFPPCGLFLEGKGMPDGMGTQTNNSFSVCHNTARTRPAAYQGNGRNVGGKTWNRESSSRNSNCHLRAASFPAAPQLSRPEGKTEAGKASVPSSHTQPLYSENLRLARGRKSMVTYRNGKWGFSKA